jgi:RHS repeat-associated protein
LTRITEPNAWQSEFTYDGQMRRRIRKEYAWQGGAWVQTNEVRYVYDGKLVIQERDSLNLPTTTYVRGRDVSSSLEGAGGIGGLLALTHHAKLITQNSTDAHSFYHADGNGNVTALLGNLQQIVARYLYDPYGNLLSIAGPLADANLYRFSSKEQHATSGLSYYLHRYYDPALQRWPNRDPLQENGGINLYGFIENNPINGVDKDGLSFTFGRAPPNFSVPCTNPQDSAYCYLYCYNLGLVLKSCTIVGITTRYPFGFWSQSVTRVCCCGGRMHVRPITP